MPFDAIAATIGVKADGVGFQATVQVLDGIAEALGRWNDPIRGERIPDGSGPPGTLEGLQDLALDLGLTHQAFDDLALPAKFAGFLIPMWNEPSRASLPACAVP